MCTNSLIFSPLETAVLRPSYTSADLQLYTREREREREGGERGREREG